MAIVKKILKFLLILILGGVLFLALAFNFEPVGRMAAKLKWAK